MQEGRNFTNNNILIALTILLVFFIPAQVFANTIEEPQSELPEIKRLKGPIKLDGISDEPAWAEIDPITLIGHSPVFEREPSERTEVLVGFDDIYFYVAGRLYDKEPGKIQATTRKRDTMNPSNDWFGVIIDTFNDKENGLAFFTTPAGLRWDAHIFNDAQPRDSASGEPSWNMSWNTFWDVETIINEEGWFVEMRIPLSSLRFQEIDGKVVWGLISWRFIPRKNEYSVFPAIPPNWGSGSIFKPSQGQEVILEGVSSPRPLYIAPYGLGGLGQSYELDEQETGYFREDDPVNQIGLDIKYGLSSNLTLDITLNTDFAQVEADDQQINLTRFSLFFPEKRLFFQERASIFDYQFGGPNRLFYSRRIGIHEDEIVPIYGGVRLVGRVSSWDLGFMNMQTAPAAELPSENFGVLRVRRQVFNAYSYIGGMTTTRIGTDGSYNVAYGLDGILRLFGDDYLSLGWAQTFEDGQDNRFDSLDSSRFRLDWERRTINGLGYSLGYSRSGPLYNPGVGFEAREDYYRFGNRILYGWLPGAQSFLMSHQLFLSGSAVLKNSDNTLESAELGPGWSWETKSGYAGTIQPKLYYESLEEVFELSDDVEIPLGQYQFYGVTGFYMTPMGRIFSLMTTLDAGTFYDGWRITLGFRPSWSVSSSLNLGGFYQFNRVGFPDRNQELIAHLGQLRIEATMSTKVTLNAFIQYSGATDTVIGNFRFRYNPSEGNDLYLVYNEVLNSRRGRETPILPYTDNRAIMVKYTYTFNIK